MIVNEKKAEEIRILVQERNDKKAELKRAQDNFAAAIGEREKGYYGHDRISTLDAKIVKLRRELRALEVKLKKKVERSEVSPGLAAIAGGKEELLKRKKSGHLFKSSRKDSHGYE